MTDYFKQPDSPAANSPVGILMVKILAKYSLTFEEARIKAHEMLALAAKAKNYRAPQVFSEAELAVRKERLRSYFASKQLAVAA